MSRKPASRADGQVLVRGAFDSKRPLAAEAAAAGLFGCLQLENGDGVPVDPEALVGRSFSVVGADDNRLYLEELPRRKP